jgi:2,4-dienoyl-CoA reductase-like NADH-dependent reductase (Old Yellow Enzyme family)
MVSLPYCKKIMTSDPVLLSPIQLGPVFLKNRIAVAPMTRVSATEDGRVTDDMVRYYKRFAAGGFGLVITEGTYPDLAYSQGYLHQPGIASDEQAETWRPVVDAVHNAGAQIVMQLMHAGALSQGNYWKQESIGPSAVRPKGEQMAFYRGEGPYRMPREISDDEISLLIADFSAAAARAKAAGFDGVEIHGANGYILDQFLTDYTNQRTDRYGGFTENRARLLIEVIQSVRDSVGRDYAVGIRISQGKVNDYVHKWANGQSDAQIIFEGLAVAGVNYVHTTEHDAQAPAFGSDNSDGDTLAGYAKRFSNVPVIANGKLGNPEAANAMLAEGKADVIALGKTALANRDWPQRAANRQAIDEFDFALLQPLAHIKESEL